jgi:hypothetical protein
MSALITNKNKPNVRMVMGMVRKINKGLTKALTIPKTIATKIEGIGVPNKTGDVAASDDLQKGYEAQVWLATHDVEAHQNDQYYFHEQIQKHHPNTKDEHLQDKFLKTCEEITGVKFPF